MKRVTGLKVLLGILSGFVLVLLILVFLLQNMEISQNKIEERINAIVSKTLPVSIKIGGLAGNPLSGYYTGPVFVNDEQATILSADKLHVFPSLVGLLQGELRLSELRITGVSVDYARIAKLRTLKTDDKEPHRDLPIDRIRIINLTTSTPYGKLLLEKALIRNNNGSYGFRANGLLDKNAIKSDGELVQNEKSKQIRGRIEWGKAQTQIKGEIFPSILLECNFNYFDLSLLPRFIAATQAANLRGISSGKITISKENNLWNVSGDINTPEGGVWKLPVSELKTEFKYTNRQLFFKKLKGNVFGSPISGDIFLRFPVSKDFELDIVAQGNNLDTTAWHGIANWLASVSGTIDSISLDIKGPIKKWRGDVEIYSSRLTYDKKYTINDTHGKIALNGSNPIGILFLGKLHGGSYSAGGTVSRAGNEFHIPLSLSKLDLNSLANEIPLLKEQQIKGDLTAELLVKKDLMGLDVTGIAESLQLSLDRQEEKLSSVLVDFSTDLKNIVIKRAAATWRESFLSCNGAISNITDAKTQLQLNGQIARLSIVNFSDKATVIKSEGLSALIGGSWILSGSRQNPELRFLLSSPSLNATVRKLSIKNIRAAGYTTLSSLTLKNLGFSFEGAPLSFAGSVLWPQNNSGIGWELTGGFSKFPVTALNRQGIISSDVDGILNGEMTLTQEHNSSALTYSLSLKKSSLIVKGIQFRDLNGSIIKSGEDLTFKKIQGGVAGGNFRVSGNITLPPDKPEQLHLNLNTVSMDIGRTLRAFSPQIRSIQGQVNSDVKLTGSLADPKVSAQISLHRFYAYGFYLPRVDIALAGTPKELKIQQVRANVGNGALNATADLRNTEGTWTTNIQANGKNLNVRVLSSYLPDETRGHLKGVLNFTFNASGTSDNFQGKGLITSPSLSVYNVTSQNMKAPFYIQDQYLTIEEATANIYGGNMKCQLAADLKSTKWGGRVDIKSGDLTGLIRDVVPGSTGSITGKTDFALRIAGDTRRTSLLDGGGRLSITEGEVTGFSGVDTLSKAMGNKPLLFKSVVSTFTIDGKNLYILPGSRVTAPTDHEAYRYLLADGSANLETGIDMTFIGNVNVRALNVFLSALQGVISSGLSSAADTKTLISDLLGSVVKGYSSKEFRDVHFIVRGKPGHFYFGDFKIAPNTKQNFRPDALDDPINSNRIKEQKFMLNIEIPVGHSSDKRKRESLKDQVKGQVLLQAIQGILNEASLGD